MKRFFAALLAALMVFSLVTIPAVAEGEVVFEVPTVNAQPGDTVSIPVTLTGSNFECHAMNMNVQYDAEALTLNSATEGDAISGATMKVLDTESELGKVKLGLLYAYDGMTAGGTLFTMNFTVFIVFCLLSIMSIYSFHRGSLPQSAHLPPKSRLYSPAVQYSSPQRTNPAGLTLCGVRRPTKSG